MRTFVAVAEIEILLYDSQSLKGKRQNIKSLISKIQNQFNVAIAELDYLELWQRSKLGLACLANTSIEAEKQLDKVLEYVEMDLRFEIIDVDKEII